MSRKPIPKIVIAAALRRIAAGEPVLAVAAELGVSKTVLFERRAAALVAEAEQAVKAKPAKSATSKAPARMINVADDVGILDHAIGLLIDRLENGPAHGTSTSARALGDLVKRRAAMRPPEQERDLKAEHEEAAGRMIARITAGLGDAERKVHNCPRCGGTFTRAELFKEGVWRDLPAPPAPPVASSAAPEVPTPAPAAAEPVATPPRGKANAIGVVPKRRGGGGFQF